MNKLLMIIGGGVEQVPAYKRAKERGFSILGTDIDPNAPALKLADYVLQVSTKNPEETASRAKKFNKSKHLHGNYNRYDIHFLSNLLIITIFFLSKTFWPEIYQW